MNKFAFAFPMLLVVFISGCVGQPSYQPTTTTTSTPVTSQTTSVTQTTSTTQTTTSQGTVKQITVHESNAYTITPSTINLNKGDIVTITIIDDSGTHNLFVDGYNVRSQIINLGQTSLQFTADKTGTFSMWCEVDGHKGLGMVGQIVVQ